jgi:hypothetical protein
MHFYWSRWTGTRVVWIQPTYRVLFIEPVDGYTCHVVPNHISIWMPVWHRSWPGEPGWGVTILLWSYCKSYLGFIIIFVFTSCFVFLHGKLSIALKHLQRSTVKGNTISGSAEWRIPNNVSQATPPHHNQHLHRHHHHNHHLHHHQIIGVILNSSFLLFLCPLKPLFYFYFTIMGNRPLVMLQKSTSSGCGACW